MVTVVWVWFIGSSIAELIGWCVGTFKRSTGRHDYGPSNTRASALFPVYHFNICGERARSVTQSTFVNLDAQSPSRILNEGVKHLKKRSNLWSC